MKPIKSIQSIHPLFALIVFAVIGFSIVLLTTPYYPLAALAGFGVIFIFLMARSPQYGFYMIIFLVPLEAYTAITSAYKFLTISKLTGVLILAVLAVRIIVNKSKSIDVKSNLWLLLIVFFVINFLSACLSDYPDTSFDILRRTIISYALFFLALSFLNRHAYSRVLPKILVVSASISAALSVFGYMFNISMFAMNVNELNYGSIKRAVGGASDPNEFCVILVFSIPLILHFFFQENRLSRKAIFSGLFVVCLVAVMMTYSRSGFVLAMIILCPFVITYFKKFKPRYIGFVSLFLLLAIIAAYVFIPESYKHRILSVADVKTDQSIGRRASYLLVGKEAIIKKPLFGHGPGTFRDLYGQSSYAVVYKWARGVDPDVNRRVAHNSYMEVIVGAGLFGFVIYMIILGIAFRNFNTAKAIFYKNAMPDMVSLTRAYQYGFLAVLVGFLFLSVNYFKYFWLALALSQAALTIAKQTSQQNLTRAS